MGKVRVAEGTYPLGGDEGVMLPHNLTLEESCQLLYPQPSQTVKAHEDQKVPGTLALILLSSNTR